MQLAYKLADRGYFNLLQIISNLTTRGDLAYLLDEVDTTDCRSCITTGNEVCSYDFNM